MVDRSRSGTIPPAPGPGRRSDPLRRRAREWPSTVAAVLFCAGLLILPALATLDLAVGLGCRDLDRSACLGLLSLSPSPE
jgi:hypothetical protein